MAGFVMHSSAQKRKLLGYWYIPKSQVNVRFYPNKKFEYNDYDSARNRSQKFTGKYTLKGSDVTLQFDDKSRQLFKFYKTGPGTKNYSLKKENDLFIKDERVNNAVPIDSGRIK